MTILEAALQYREKNLSVIPCDKQKKPLVSWLEFQKRIASEEEIRAWYTKWPDMNLGIVTGEISNLTVLDCDSHDAVTAFRTLYKGQTVTVKTPRGTHYYFQYAEGTRNTVKVMGLDIDIRSSGGYVVAPPSKNGEGLAYSFIKGFKDVALDIVSSLVFNTGVDNTGKNMSTSVYNSLQTSTMFEHGRRDESLFHVANCLAKGHMTDPEIKQVLLVIMRSWGEHDERWAQDKVKSAMERINRKERNLAEEVLEYVLSTTGYILSTEVEKCLHLSTRQETKNLSIILKRLSNQGVIEKHGQKNGCWRRVDKDIEIIDWKNADEKDYPIELPLGLSGLVKLYPGNIAVVAGASNTGKTALMLEIIRLNQKQHKIHYFNSEMGASELKIRLNQFPENLIKYNPWNFTAVGRSSNFADVIQPDAMNIIDFMEVYDEFYKIGGWIRDIHSKLKSGIAIIAIQKKASTKSFNQQFGRGGELTLEKPRLYLSMDRGRIEIVKAKIWKNHDVNPNGMVRKFNLIGGCEFKPLKNTVWEVEGEKYTGFSSEASRYEQD